MIKVCEERQATVPIDAARTCSSSSSGAVHPSPLPAASTLEKTGLMSPARGSSIAETVHVGVSLRVAFVALDGPLRCGRVLDLVVEEDGEETSVNVADDVPAGLELVVPVLEFLRLPLPNDWITKGISEQYPRIW